MFGCPAQVQLLVPSCMHGHASWCTTLSPTSQQGYNKHHCHIPIMLQIPLGQSGELKQVVCWEFEGTAFDQGNEAASWFTKYLESPHRLVRYAGHPCFLLHGPQMLRICPCCKSEGQLQLSLYHTGGESKSSIQSDSSRRPTDPKWTTDQEVAFADGFPALLVSLVSRSSLCTFMYENTSMIMH